MIDSAIIKKNHIFVIGSTEPLESAMIFESALNLISKDENVTVLDLISQSKSPLNFYFAEKYRLFKHNLLIKKLLKNKKIKIIKFNLKYETMNEYAQDIISAAYKAAKLEIISLKRDIMPCKICNNKHLTRLSNLYLNIYGQFLEFISNTNNSCIYVYNGRFLIGNACWEVAKVSNNEIRFLEQFTMNKSNEYWIFNKPVHSIVYRAEVINDFLENYDKNKFNQLERAGINWFSDRVNGISHNFTSDQILIYQKASNDRKLISYFPSSEDELILLGIENEVWGNQKKIISDLADYFYKKGGIDFTIRLHPNTNHKSGEEVSRLMNFKFELEKKYNFINVINYNEKINTYSLIQQSDLVITSGSTVGLEAAFLKIPNILIGDSLYQAMRVAYNPVNLNELKDNFNSYLADPDKERHYLNALKVGMFHSSGGLPYKFIKMGENGKNISICNYIINGSKIYSVCIKIDKFLLNFKKKIIHREAHMKTSL